MPTLADHAMTVLEEDMETYLRRTRRDPLNRLGPNPYLDDITWKEAPMDPKVIAGEKLKKDRPSYSVLPLRALRGVIHAFRNGAEKYGRLNWRKPGQRLQASVYFDAAMDHMEKWWEGEECASDSHLNHLDHAIAGLLIIRDSQYEGRLDDDRPLALIASADAEASVVARTGREVFAPISTPTNYRTQVFIRRGTDRRVKMWAVPETFAHGVTPPTLAQVMKWAPPWVRAHRKQFMLTEGGKLLKRTRKKSESWKVVNGMAIFKYIDTTKSQSAIVAYQPSNFNKYYTYSYVVWENELEPKDG